MIERIRRLLDDKADAALVALLFAFGLLLALHYAKIGFMPLDGSIVFDGGWRILSGQVPFRDFTAPTGLTPSLLQAAFFGLLGVNWFAYALHAAIFNGAFAVGVFALLRMVGAGPGLAFAYSVASAVVFYPPSGTPYMEQHAFFFSFVALLCAVAAEQSTSARRQFLLVGIIPALLVAAYLSKQIPTVFLVPGLFVVLLTRRIPLTRVLTAVTVGTVFVAILVGGVGIAAGVRASLLRTYFFDLPSGTGKERLAELHWADSAKELAYHLVHATCCGTADGWKLVTVEIGRSLALGVLLGALLIAGARATPIRALHRPLRLTGIALALAPLIYAVGVLSFRWMRQPGSGLILIVQLVAAVLLTAAIGALLIRSDLEMDKSSLGLLAGAWSLLMGSLLFTRLTFNHPANGAALAFVCVGLVHATLPRSLSGAPPPRSVRLRPLFDFLLIGILVLDVYRFDLWVNRPRAKTAPAPAVESTDPLPAGLSSMSWKVSDWYHIGPADLTAFVDFMDSHDGAFLLIGDHSILYGLTGRPSVNPSLWYHPGLATPRPGTVEYADYKRRLFERMERYDVRYVVEEPDGTWMGDDLVALREGMSFCGSESAGRFLVRRVC